jgi:hypothetical protein
MAIRSTTGELELVGAIAYSTLGKPFPGEL